jgi:hypothetical protein
MQPNPFFVEIKTQLLPWKKEALKFGIFKKTAQSKQSPNGRKFTQSGHTVCSFYRETGDGKSLSNRNLRTRSGMHLCMQDDQNGQKMMVLPSADKTRLTHFTLSKKIF